MQQRRLGRLGHQSSVLIYVLPHRVAAWRILDERLEQLAGRADRLSGAAGLAQLGELAINLHGMARDIESA